MKTRVCTFLAAIAAAQLLAPAASLAEVNLTAAIKPLVLSTKHSAVTGTTTVQVVLRNVSAKVVTGPFRLVVQGLGNDAGRLVKPSGYTADGRPFLLFPEVKLSPGRTTKARALLFGTRCAAGVRAVFKPFGDATAFPVDTSCGKDVTTYYSVSRPDPARNASPVADAGPDQRAGLRQTLQLDGTASTDRDGDRLAYSWTLVSRPRGSVATIKGARAAVASLTVDRAGIYVARMAVSDGAPAGRHELQLVRSGVRGRPALDPFRRGALIPAEPCGRTRRRAVARIGDRGSPRPS